MSAARFSREPLLKGIKNRLLQLIALFAPGQATLRATLHRWRGVRMGKPVYIGTDVTIGRGAVIAAGSIVTRSVPSMTMVQGNPARPIARCEVPLTFGSSFRDFLFRLKPIPGRTSDPAGPDD